MEENLENSLIKTSKTLLTIWQATESIEPLRQRILLLKTVVAGTYFANAKDVIPENSKKPVAVKLKREPENKYDSLAILVLTEEGQKLGYVPKIKNEILARLLDAGKHIDADLVRYTHYADGIEIEIEIYFSED
ncbi:MAG: HIRAN domain-containing protein [Pyrinomonadaceae bacterium]